MSQPFGEAAGLPAAGVAEQDQALQLTRRHLLALVGVGGGALLLGACSGEQAPAAGPETPATAGTSGKPSAANTAPARSGEFADEPSWVETFDGPLNPNRWAHDENPDVPGYNDEKQAYRPANVETKDGALVITARKERGAYPGDPEGRTFGYTSGKIMTHNPNGGGALPEGLTFEYGKVEATIKMPSGRGVWPAFWTLSANQRYTGPMNPTDADWEKERFYLHDGELDVVEYYGHSPGMIEGTAHTYEQSVEGHTTVRDAEEAFHTYGVEVTPESITWTVDGKPYKKFEKPSDNPDQWPFGNGNELYVMLNLAMGGSGGGRIDDSKGPWRMEVQQVQFFEYTGAKK